MGNGVFFPLSFFLSLLSNLDFYDAYIVIMHICLKIGTVTCNSYFELFLNFCLNNFLNNLANFHSLVGSLHLGEFSSLQQGLTFYTWQRQLFSPLPKVWWLYLRSSLLFVCLWRFVSCTFLYRYVLWDSGESRKKCFITWFICAVFLVFNY